MSGCDEHDTCRQCQYNQLLGGAITFRCGPSQYCCGRTCCNELTYTFLILVAVIFVLLAVCLWFFWLYRRRCNKQTSHTNANMESRAPDANKPEMFEMACPASLAPPGYSDMKSVVPHYGPPAYDNGSNWSLESLPKHPPSYKKNASPPRYDSVFNINDETGSKQEAV